MIYILTHEYSDKSAFRVCGLTENREVALAWRGAGIVCGSSETHVHTVATLEVIDVAGLPEWDEKE